ncbi:MAG: precorrin-3B C(17)-methyltransferase [Thermoleophilia bacterium]|nr:precorrin-3B C(17)-methyltransferase [Thermoleophilia bacterium]
MTIAAEEALKAADVVAGYGPYVDLVASLIPGKRIIRSGMRKEMERAALAVDEAKRGFDVAVISSGDAGIYGMCGLVLELLPPESAIEVEIVPGVTAASAAAACLGAPLMNDFAVISLSDLLTPLPVIERRLAGAIAGDFVIALYNPRSSGRVDPLRRALALLRASRPGGTPVGIVREALREGQVVTITTLDSLSENEVDMKTVVIIGNSATEVHNGRIVTARGYPARHDGARREEVVGS